MIKRTLRSALISGLALTGSISACIALFSPQLSDALIIQTVELLNQGMDINEIRPALDGILAGGTVSVVHPTLAVALYLYGVSAIFLAIYLFLNPYEGALRRLATLEYWQEFFWRPSDLRRRDVMKARRALEKRALGRKEPGLS